MGWCVCPSRCRGSGATLARKERERAGRRRLLFSRERERECVFQFSIGQSRKSLKHSQSLSPCSCVLVARTPADWARRLLLARPARSDLAASCSIHHMLWQCPVSRQTFIPCGSQRCRRPAPPPRLCSCRRHRRWPLRPSLMQPHYRHHRLRHRRQSALVNSWPCRE